MKFYTQIHPNLPKSGKVYLCPAGACPYFEFKENYVILFDDKGKVIVEENKKGNVKIIIPREYIEELLKML